MSGSGFIKLHMISTKESYEESVLAKLDEHASVKATQAAKLGFDLTPAAKPRNANGLIDDTGPTRLRLKFELEPLVLRRKRQRH